MSPTLTAPEESRLCLLRKKAISFFDETLVWIWPSIAIPLISLNLITWKNVGTCASLAFIPLMLISLIFLIGALILNVILVTRFPRYRKDERERDGSPILMGTIQIFLVIGVPALFAGMAMYTSFISSTTLTAYADGKNVVVDYQAGWGEDKPFASKIREIQGIRYYADDAGKLTPLVPVAQHDVTFVLGDVNARHEACFAFARRVEKESFEARASVAPEDVEKAGK